MFPRQPRKPREKESLLGKQMQQCLRELAELNKERNLQRAREADSQ
jgi:hypothetical protein